MKLQDYLDHYYEGVDQGVTKNGTFLTKEDVISGILRYVYNIPFEYINMVLPGYTFMNIYDAWKRGEIFTSIGNPPAILGWTAIRQASTGGFYDQVAKEYHPVTTLGECYFIAVGASILYGKQLSNPYEYPNHALIVPENNWTIIRARNEPVGQYYRQGFELFSWGSATDRDIVTIGRGSEIVASLSYDPKKGELDAVPFNPAYGVEINLVPIWDPYRAGSQILERYFMPFIPGLGELKSDATPDSLKPKSIISRWMWRRVTPIGRLINLGIDRFGATFNSFFRSRYVAGQREAYDWKPFKRGSFYNWRF